MNNNYLSHYGVLGMKWGVRRDRSSSGNSEKRRIRQENKIQKKQRKQDAKNRRTLSDDLLRKRVERLQMERKLKDLTEQDLHPGRKAVSDFLKSTGGRVLTAAATGALAYAGHRFLSGESNRNQMANYIFPNPNKKK